MSKFSALEATVKTQGTSLGELKTETVQLKKEIDGLKTENVQLKKEIADVKQENAAIQKKFDDQSLKFNDLKKDHFALKEDFVIQSFHNNCEMGIREAVCKFRDEFRKEMEVPLPKEEHSPLKNKSANNSSRSPAVLMNYLLGKDEKDFLLPFYGMTVDEETVKTIKANMFKIAEEWCKRLEMKDLEELHAFAIMNGGIIGQINIDNHSRGIVQFDNWANGGREERFAKYFEWYIALPHDVIERDQGTFYVSAALSLSHWRKGLETPASAAAQSS